MKALHKFLFLLLIVMNFAACTSIPSGLTKTDDEDNDIGLGGTGLLAENSIHEKTMGGTGILGKITGFGSIFVNGIEVEYNDKTPFSINGKTAKHQQLHIGDIVEILTEDTNKYTHAAAINLRHEVIGEVTSIDPATYSFMINNQKIIQPINTLSFPEIGERVAVAGFRINKQTVVSSRITTTTRANLLRTHMDLPFKHKSKQWLVQLHINEKANFTLNGTSHTINIDKANEVMASSLNIKILKLKQSASKELMLKELINPAEIPAGRPQLEPTNWNSRHKTVNQQPWANPKQWQNNGAGSGLSSPSGTGPRNFQNGSNRSQ